MNPSIDALHFIFQRDLDKLKEEMKAYTDESHIWKVAPGISNAAGNLCLHICGNLQHFFGAVISQDGYKRRRDDEFGLSDVPVSALLEEIEKARYAVKQGLDDITDDLWSSEYPVKVFDDPMTYARFITHLSGHLMYHLGQINYHRRLLG